MKAIVTGGAGFIGSHIVDRLCKEGFEVLILDNLSSGLIENINENASFLECDVRYKEASDAVKEFKPDYIFHLAAQMSVPYSVEDPFNDLDVNGNGILNLLEAAREINLKKFIFSSTGGAIYGDAVSLPTPETEKPQPLAPYGITKLLSENYLYFYKENYHLDYTVLRYSNVYGPRQMNAHESGVITIFIRKVLANEAVKVYHYEDEPLGMIRDYVYVNDVVNANIKAMDSEAGIYNIGTAVSTRTKELYDMISEISGIEVPVSFHPPREGDIKANTLDNSLAKEKMNWEPEFPIKDGMSKTIDYFKEMDSE